MKLAQKVASLLALLFTFAGLSAAQVATGLPPFAAFGGGPDQINLANLNIHLNLPVVYKVGRGLPLAYNLSYDGSIWTPVTSSGTKSWEPLTPPGGAPQNSYGFTMWTTAWVGWISFTSTEAGCYDGDCWYNLSNFSYFDASGTSHPFPSFTCQYSGGTCSGSALAADDSGYTLVFDYPTQVSGVIDRAGNFVSSYYSPPGIQDSNGNYLSSSVIEYSATVTDTLGENGALGMAANTTQNQTTYVNPSGQNIVVSFTTHTMRTAFGCSGISEWGPYSVGLVSSIAYPDGTSYSFTYEQTPGYTGDTTGRIASVTLRNGGTIEYSYTGANDGIECADGSTANLTRQTPDGTWTYARTLGSGVASTTTITAPTYNSQNSQTLMNFQGIYPTEKQVYQGSSSGGTLLKTEITCYNGSTPTGTPATCNSAAVTLPITQKAKYTQWPGGLESETHATYNAYGLITENDEYGYGSGSPGSIARKTLTSYASLGNNISDKPSQVTIEDGSNNIKSQASYTYDQGSVTATSGTAQHNSVSGSRGNVTTVSDLVAGSATLSETLTYYDTGMLNVTTDINEAQTTYSYSSTTCANAFPTGVTEPLSLTRAWAWNCLFGVATTVTDENGATTSYGWSTTGNSYCYTACPIGITDPLGNFTQLSYTGQTSQESSMVFDSSSSTVDMLSTLDELGRPHLSQRKQSPSSSTYDSVETDYDSLGRPSSSKLPYAATAGQACSGTCPAVVSSYDALNRPSSVSDAGGGTLSYAYSQNDVLLTAGPAPTGENTKRKQLEYDGLGRLTSVCEITSATGSGRCGQNNPQTGYWTTYTYDANNNLTGVTQNAQSSGPQTRTYAYDDLGRLTSETNPENATTAYTYDTDSTCGTSHGDLVKKIDPVGNTICFAYDARHRMISTTYSGTYASVTANRYFVYDSSTVDSVAMVDAKSRMAEAYTCFSPCSTKLTDVGFSYTVRGEISDVYESAPHSSGFNHVKQTYWANGETSAFSALSGLPTINYNVDGEGRPYSATAFTGQNPLSSTAYNVASLPTAVNLGSSDGDSFTYDPNTNRMTGYTFSVNGGSVVGNLTWNPLGTLGKLAITDTFNSSDTQNCNYAHDDLVRVASANCGSVWSQTFSYDAFGNINKSGSSSFGATYSTSTNHMTMIGSSTPSYDSNGNVTNDFLNTYAWDANGRPVTVDTVGITYDALGRMVEQNRSGVYTEIVYTPSGAKFALMTGSSLQKGFVPLTGGSMAVYNSSGLAYYRHSDWLGSSRFASTPSRAMYFDGAYGPFGEPYAQDGATDLSFTGQNQDTAANVYDFPAREYGIQGRWPSPDPAGIASAQPSDPQTWNRYAYARNDPLALVDPTGEDSCGLPVPGIGANCEDGGEASEIPDLGDIMDGTWFDTVFGPQNQTYGGNNWDQYLDQLTFQNQYNNLPSNHENAVNPNTDAQDWVGYQNAYWNQQQQIDSDTDVVCTNDTCTAAQETHWTTAITIGNQGDISGQSCNVGDPCYLNALANQVNLRTSAAQRYIFPYFYALEGAGLAGVAGTAAAASDAAAAAGPRVSYEFGQAATSFMASYAAGGTALPTDKTSVGGWVGYAAGTALWWAED